MGQIRVEKGRVTRDGIYVRLLSVSWRAQIKTSVVLCGISRKLTSILGFRVRLKGNSIGTSVGFRSRNFVPSSDIGSVRFGTEFRLLITDFAVWGYKLRLRGYYTLLSSDAEYSDSTSHMFYIILHSVEPSIHKPEKVKHLGINHKLISIFDIPPPLPPRQMFARKCPLCN